MGKTAILAVRIIGDATSAVQALDKVDGSAKSMQATMDKASAGAGIALAGLAAAAVAAGNAASELQQATGAVDSVFGEYAQKVHDYAKSAANDVGLSAEAYSQLSAVLGSQLKNMGVEMDAVSDHSRDLIALGADLSATFGGTTADAVSAVSSLLRGERDPIERYGVSLKQVDIDAKLAAMGLEDLTGEAEKAAVTQATLALLTEQTAAAQGQFGREADTAAGMQQRANAAWTDAQAALGEQLLPLMTEAAGILAEVAQWAGENTETVTVLAGAIGGLAAGILVINGAMKAYAAVQAIQTAAQWASNAAWLASPITWIVIAIVAAIGLVIAAVLLVIEYWDEIERFGAEVWGNIMGWVEDAAAAFEPLVAWIEDAYHWFMRFAESITPGWIKDLFGIQSFSARMEVEAPAEIRAPRMLASADETMAAFSYRTSPTVTMNRAAPGPGDFGGFGDDRPPASGDTYNITIQTGVGDPDAIAREIERLLAGNRRTQGLSRAGGGSW